MKPTRTRREHVKLNPGGFSFFNFFVAAFWALQYTLAYVWGFFFWLYPHPRRQAWFISPLISLHDLSQLSAHLTVMIISEQLILNVLRPHSGFTIMRAIIQDHVARPCYLGVREVERVISFGHTVTLHFCHILPNISSCYWSKQWKHVAS